MPASSRTAASSAGDRSGQSPANGGAEVVVGVDDREARPVDPVGRDPEHRARPEVGEAQVLVARVARVAHGGSMMTTWPRWRGASGSQPRVRASVSASAWAGWRRSGRRAAGWSPPPMRLTVPGAPRASSASRARTHVSAPNPAASATTRSSSAAPAPPIEAHDEDARLAHGDRAVAELERLVGARGDLARLGQLEAPLRGDAERRPAAQDDDPAPVGRPEATADRGRRRDVGPALRRVTQIGRERPVAGRRRRRRRAGARACSRTSGS